MLRIRPDQLAALESHMRKQFVARMVANVHQHFPDECETLDDDELGSLIDGGIDRAKSHEFRTESDVSRFINLMFTFGVGFDRDVALPWVGRLLNSPQFEPGTARMNALYVEAEKHLGEAKGLQFSPERNEP